MKTKMVCVFKVALKYRKRLWRRIEIKSNQTLGDFDQIIRIAFDHDDDHLSEFFSGRVWRSEGYGEITPWGGGEGAMIRIDQLLLSVGDKIEYVYDFGTEIQHIITLEKIVEPEKGIKYPRMISQNKPKYRYCELCQKQGNQTIATWICIQCSEKEQSEVLLCEDCLMEEHEDHYSEELLY